MDSNHFSIKHVPVEAAKSMMMYAQMAGEFSCNENYIAKRKKYDSILLMVTLSGKGYLKYRNKVFQADKNTGVIINCNEPHVYFTDKKDLWHFVWLHFKGGQSIDQASYIIDKYGPLFNARQIPLVQENMFKILKLLSRSGISCDIQVSGWLNEIMTKLMLKALPMADNTRALPDCVGRALSIMESCYSKEFNMEELSAELFTNKYDLIRKFKKHLGTTPYEYLISCRIKHAKTLLETTQMPISEVAKNVGFEDPSYFIKVFKHHESTTPLKYKRYWEQ